MINRSSKYEQDVINNQQIVINYESIKYQV